MRFEPSLFGNCTARSMQPRNVPKTENADVPYPVPFGTVGIANPFVIYHGKEGTTTWNEREAFKASTHLGWCVGPVVWRLLMANGTTLWSEILQRKTSPTWALLDPTNVATATGPISTDERIYIEGDSFGGNVEFYVGDSPVLLSQRVADFYGVPVSDLPSNNGIAQMFFDSFVWGPSKPDEINLVAQVTRMPRALPLNQAYVEIPNNGTLVYEVDRVAPDKVGLIEHPYPPDANPAHILYELLTDPWFGLRVSPDMIDTASFNDAALTLYNEGFGLSFLWAEQCPVEEVIADVIEHIQGVLYTDPTSGKWKLRLMRRDYAITDPGLPVLDESNSYVIGMQIKHCTDSANELTVQWMNPGTELLEAVVVEETASFFSTEDVNSITRTYYMARTPELAFKLAVRDIRQLAVKQRTLQVETTRAFAHLRPGDVCKVNWPTYRLSNVPFRVKSIDLGSSSKGAVKLHLVEDVYALDYDQPPPRPYNKWQAFYTDPTPVDVQDVRVLPYGLIGERGENIAVFTKDAAKDFRGVKVTVSRNIGNTTVWEPVGEATKIDNALTGSTLSAEEETIINLDTFLNQFSGDWGPDIGWPMFIGDEIVIPTSYDSNTRQLTLLRGAFDTLPAAHGIGERIWITNRHSKWRVKIERNSPFDYRLHTLTMLGELDAPPVNTFTEATDRIERPLRPANVTTAGTAWPAQASAAANTAFSISWAIRNRETDRLSPAKWNDPSHQPETGQETHIEIIDSSTNAVVWSTIATGTTDTVSVAGGLAAGNYIVRLWSRRDGLDSLNVVEQTLVVA